MNSALLRMLTHMRNALAVQSAYVSVPYSSLVISVLENLKDHRFIQSYKDTNDNNISVRLIYTDKGHSVIRGLKVVSKPSIRTYLGAKDIKQRFARNGMYILSTNRGILSSAQAKRLNTGGEVLFLVW